MAGFFYRKHMHGLTTGATAEFIIDDSETVTIGDAVDLNSGYIQVVDAGDLVLGIVIGIADANGINVDGNGADIDGTVSGSGPTLTYAAASDNTTDKKVVVQVMCDPFALFYNDADGDLEQAEIGKFGNVVSTGDQIDASDVGAADYGQFQFIEWDPDGDADASKGLFRIAEWQGWCYAQRTS